jgi:alpha-tubulin suppressor-like RCC1 family protein
MRAAFSVLFGFWSAIQLVYLGYPLNPVLAVDWGGGEVLEMVVESNGSSQREGAGSNRAGVDYTITNSIKRDPKGQFRPISGLISPVPALPVHSSFSNLIAWGDRRAKFAVMASPIPGGISTLVSGSRHSLALDADGRIHAWGRNASKESEVPAGLSNIVAVAAGSRHSVAVTSDGGVMAWGQNWSGQTNVPKTATNAVMVSAGEAHSVCLRADGTVVAWGDNESEQLEIPILANNIMAIDCGYFHTLALRSDGTVVSWGINLTALVLDQERRVANQFDEAVPADATNVVSISAGWAHNLALRADGSVLAWGDNRYGQTTVPASATNVVAIEAGFYHSLALRSDGTVIAWGRDVFRVVSDTSAVSGAVGISTGEDHALALLQDRIVLGTPCAEIWSAVGRSAVLQVPLTGPIGLTFQWTRDGSIIDGATAQRLVLRDCATTNAGSYVLRVNDGSKVIESRPIRLVVAKDSATLVGRGGWGDNLLGQCNLPLDLNAPVAIAAGGFHGLALEPDGRILGWGKNKDGQISPPSFLTNVIAISAGGDHSMALTDAGRVIAWGRNWDGQTVVPESARDPVGISAGWAHCLALNRDGTVVAWGNNDYGQTEVPPWLREVVAVAAGYYHNAALRADGSVVSWGEIDVPPSGLPPLVAIAAGWGHCLGLTGTGQVVAWGRNDYGETQVPPNATNVVSVSAGYGFSLALTVDGKVLAWGKRWFGATRLPSGLSGISRISAGEDFSIALAEEGPPRIVRRPITTRVRNGSPGRLMIEASGGVPISYQWLRGGTMIEGANQPVLRVDNADPTDEVGYSVVIANRFGSAASATANLEVVVDPGPIPVLRIISNTMGGHDGIFAELRAPEGMELTVDVTSDLAVWREDQRVHGAGDGTAVRVRLASESGMETRFWRVRW